MIEKSSNSKFTQILGLNFFHGSAKEAADMMEGGGLLVVPAAPALRNLTQDADYRQALLDADLVITDSGFMVLLWNVLQRDSISRLSGLEYMRELITRPDFRQPGRTFWVMAGTESAAKNVTWLQSQGIRLEEEDYYVAPVYTCPIEDEKLLNRVRHHGAAHVVLTLGGGTQECLGLYLKRNLNYPVAVHCTGAAISFLSGDQVHIPSWADKLFLGWLFRCFADPRRYGPRYWGARRLLPLLIRNRERLPEFRHAA